MYEKEDNMAKEKEQWVTVRQFMEHYQLPIASAYERIHAKGFPSKKVGPRSYRVDLSKTDEFFEKYYNY